MKTNNLKQAIGVFPNQQTVEQVLNELQNINFPMHQISVVTNSDATQNSLDKTNQVSPTRVEGAKAGAIQGSVGVGLTTLTIGLGVLFIPGVGPAIALDSILTALLGSGLASAVGGLYGAFLGCVDPKKHVKLHGEQLEQGNYLVIIEATENQILSVEPMLHR